MPSGFDFHAKTAEQIDFVFDAARAHSLFVTAIYDDESSAVVLVEPGSGVTSVAEENLRWLCMTKSKPNLKGVNQDFNFVDRNGNRLSIILGDEKALALRPSMLQYPTNQPDTKLWKSVASALKKRLSKGGWFYRPSIHAKRLDKSLLFSVGAIELYNRGGELLDIGKDMLRMPGLESTDPRLTGAREA